MKIGFIGLGNMGSRMAACLSAAGYDLLVYTRNQDKLQQYSKEHAVAAASREEIARNCAWIFTMLADDEAVEQSYEVLLQNASGKYLVEMSTISSRLSTKLASAVADSGNYYIDAPVSGSINAAEAGSLVFMYGSEQTPPQQFFELLGAMGSSSFSLGPAGAGHTAKLLINSVIHSENQIAAEIVCASKGVGLDTEQLLNLLGESAAGSPMLRFRKDIYLDRQQDVTFSTELAAKDMRLVNELCREQSLELPQIQLNGQELENACQSGLGRLDMGMLWKNYKMPLKIRFR